MYIPCTFIAAGTYFEQGGGLRNKTGGGGGHVTGVMRDTMIQATFVNKSFIYSFNISEFVFIVAVFIKKKNIINKTMNHNAFVLKERKYLIQRK